MTVRKCKYEDILSVSELEKECFKGESWSYGTIASAFENPAYCMLVAEEDGAVIGYGCTCTACESCDLENVLVAEEYRNSGVGKAIINGLIADAKGRGAEKILLEVIKINSKDLHSRTVLARLYERMNRLSDAKRLYQELCDIDPNNRFGIEGLSRLK